MSIGRQISAAPAAQPWPRRMFGGGTAGNEQLTAVTGLVLIVLLAVIGVTILRLRGPLLSIHLFVGIALIGPVALKLASTGYRFVRYYTANPLYRSKGPPAIALRVIAPFVVLTTVVVFASGVVLLFAGPSSRDTLLPIHKVSFIVWIAFTAIHVLAHLPAVVRVLTAKSTASPLDGGFADRRRELDGRGGRAVSLAGAIALGVVLAILVIPEFGPWLSTHGFHHH
jgi:hypothetical protein